MVRGAPNERRFDAGSCGGVAKRAQADVLARDLEAVVVLLHVIEDGRVVGRDLVGEVVTVTHVLGPPLGLLVQIGVVGQGVQARGGAVLVVSVKRSCSSTG